MATSILIKASPLEYSIFIHEEGLLSNEFHSAIASFVIKIIPTREKDLGICDDFVAPSQGNPDQIEHLATNGLKFLF